MHRLPAQSNTLAGPMLFVPDTNTATDWVLKPGSVPWPSCAKGSAEPKYKRTKEWSIFRDWHHIDLCYVYKVGARWPQDGCSDTLRPAVPPVHPPPLLLGVKPCTPRPEFPPV